MVNGRAFASDEERLRVLALWPECIAHLDCFVCAREVPPKHRHHLDKAICERCAD
jgi:hypothetical protein